MVIVSPRMKSLCKIGVGVVCRIQWLHAVSVEYNNGTSWSRGAVVLRVAGSPVYRFTCCNVHVGSKYRPAPGSPGNRVRVVHLR